MTEIHSILSKETYIIAILISTGMGTHTEKIETWICKDLPIW
jgi:hypothetical protein